MIKGRSHLREAESSLILTLYNQWPSVFSSCRFYKIEWNGVSMQKWENTTFYKGNGVSLKKWENTAFYTGNGISVKKWENITFYKGNSVPVKKVENAASYKGNWCFYKEMGKYIFQWERKCWKKAKLRIPLSGDDLFGKKKELI